MFFYIIGSENLSINKEFKIKFHTLVDSENRDSIVEKYSRLEDGRIKLKLYGIEYTVDAWWLYLLAANRCTLPKGFTQYITRFKFIKSYEGFVKSKNNMIKGKRLPFHILFSEPIYILPGFRLIAEFTDYAISDTRELYYIKEKRIIVFRNYVNNSYIYGRFFSRFFREITARPMHVLAALTWIANDDYVANPIVNHINGDKRDWSVKNLEWTDHVGNIKHAYENGLRLDNKPVKVYDSLKKTIVIYHSVTEAFKSFGAKPRANLDQLFAERNGYYIAKNRYEIRYLTDVNDFALMKMTIKEASKVLNTVIKRRVTYQAINTKTKEEVVGGNTVIQKALNITESAVTSICRKKTFFGDWIIREFSEDELDMSNYSKVKNSPVLIKGYNGNTGKEYIFKSLREAGRESKFDPITIKRLINGNASYSDGWKFSYVKEEDAIMSPSFIKKIGTKKKKEKYLNTIEKRNKFIERLDQRAAKRLEGIENDLKQFYAL